MSTHSSSRGSINPVRFYILTKANILDCIEVLLFSPHRTPSAVSPFNAELVGVTSAPGKGGKATIWAVPGQLLGNEPSTEPHPGEKEAPATLPDLPAT